MNTKNTYSTILSSTKSGKAGFYGIGTEIETPDHSKYIIRSAFEAECPDGSKPFLLICTYEVAKKRIPKFQFVILRKFTDQFYGYGNIPGIYSFCKQLNEGKIGYEIKTNKGKYQVAHDFWFQGKHCFVCTKKSYFGKNVLEVLWHNPENDKYYKIMCKD